MGRLEHPQREKIEDYRRRAVDAAKLAVAARDPQMQKAWERIATCYDELATWLERNFKEW